MLKKKYFKNMGAAVLLLALCPYIISTFYCKEMIIIGSVLLAIGCVLVGMYFYAIYLVEKKDNIIFLHTVSAISALFAVLYGVFLMIFQGFSGVLLILILSELSIAALYFAGITLKEVELKINGMFFKYILFFCLLLAFADSFSVSWSNGYYDYGYYYMLHNTNISFFSMAAIVLAGVAYFLYCKNLLNSYVVYGVVGACFVGSIVKMSLFFAPVIRSMMFPTLIVLLGTIIIYIILTVLFILRCKEYGWNMYAKAKPIEQKIETVSADEKFEKLEKLLKLKEAGVLTDEEFQAQKNKVLGEN